MRNLPRWCRPGFAIPLAVLPLACGKSQTAAPPPAVPAATATVPAGPGTVAGAVHFAGPRPEEMQAPGECCPGVPAPADETVVVNPNGTLRNVTVYIKDGPHLATTEPAEAVLAQDGCRYVPHVLALRVGQKVVVTNHDPTLHNVHIDAPNNRSDNFGQTRGDSRAVTFDHPDDVEFKCDVHAWMRAHAMVFDHPCFAVTGDDGSFHIDHLPLGTYTVIAHHEQLGDLQQTVTVTAEKPSVAVTFDYQP